MKEYTVTICFTIEAESSDSAFAFGHSIVGQYNIPNGVGEVILVESENDDTI